MIARPMRTGSEAGREAGPADGPARSRKQPPGAQGGNRGGEKVVKTAEDKEVGRREERERLVHI